MSLGAQIIDLMMLVVDVVKGMQTQTAECLLIGQLTCSHMIVILNKTDLLPSDKRQSAIEKMTKRMHKTLENTRCTLTDVLSCVLINRCMCNVHIIVAMLRYIKWRQFSSRKTIINLYANKTILIMAALI